MASPVVGGKLKIVLIRHGESFNNVLCSISMDEYRGKRLADPPLSSKGELQADHLGLFLHGLGKKSSTPNEGPANGLIGKIDNIFVSPMIRALQTADPIAKRTNLTPEIWTDCFEHGGIYLRDPKTGERKGLRGITMSELNKRFPTYVAPSDMDAKGWYRGGYETAKECALRAKRVSERLRRMATSTRVSSSTVCLVAHHDFIDVLMRHLLSISVHQPPVGHFFFNFNASISCITIDGTTGHTGLLCANFVRHLPDSLVSWGKLGVV